MEVVLPSSTREEVPKVSKQHAIMQKRQRQLSQAGGMLMENHGPNLKCSKTQKFPTPNYQDPNVTGHANQTLTSDQCVVCY